MKERVPPTAASIFGPIFDFLLHPDWPMRVEFWDGSCVGAAQTDAIVKINSPEAFRRILWSPGELGLARAYVSGDIDFLGDPFLALSGLTKANPNYLSVGVRTFVEVLRGAVSLGAIGRSLPVPPEEVKPAGKVHSKFRDARAITHHYDVGNDFYRLFLGESMTYSCARFVTGDESLADAQAQKYDLVCRKLGLGRGMRLLDVGCGWGGMVLHAASNYGVRAVGITLSEQQAALAKDRVESAGLSNLIEIRLQDYRDLADEPFDAISSIGMFEHVGREQLGTYFNKLFSKLKPTGRLLNHAIDSVHGSRMAENGFIHRYVFPDGELQDVSVAISAMQDVGFEVRDVESLREHYAATLRKWVGGLEDHWDEAVRLVGSRRARIWWIYMVGSAVSFEDNRISIHQTLAVKPTGDGESAMPLTRQDFV